MSAKKSTIIFTKENPIYFSSFEDMKNKIATVNCKHSFYKFECEDCGKESIRPAHRNIEQNIFLCSRCKRIKTSLERYGVKSTTALKETQDKIKQTCLEKYGTESPSQNKDVIQKMLQTQKEKYGGDPRMTAESRAKAKQTFIEKYGVDNPLKNEDIRLKAKQTIIKRYGSSNYWNNEGVRKKCKQTCLERYGNEYYIMSDTGQAALKDWLDKNGVANTALLPEVAEKIRQKAIERVKEFGLPSHKYIFKNEKFDSSWELAYYIYNIDNNIPVEREPSSIEYVDDNGDSRLYFPDFKIGNDLIEIKGGHLINENNELIDFKTKQVLHNKTRCLKDNNVKILLKEDIIPYLEYIDKTYTSDFLQLFRTDLPFPYPNANLANVSDYGLIQHFHKSIFDASKKGKLSPKEAWQNKDLILKSALNRLQYEGNCSPEAVLGGFSVAHIAPKISVFKPTFAKKLIIKYLNDYEQIFDPFSGFSGRMIGAMNCNKQYIGHDINEDHVRESNEIIKFKDYANCQVVQQDILTDSHSSYESLFTCPPYGDKEHWAENEVEKSCDEWIDICLEKYKCKKYLFVVDNTEKYKNYIVEQIVNKSHFGSNTEYVILI